MSQERYALVGMPGSGKSTVGACLAQKLGIAFYDLDALITQKIGMPIPDYFKEEGEQAFRRTEHEVLIHFLTTTEGSWVLACGGGTPCFFDHMERLNAACRTIFLDIEEFTLLKRLKEKGQHTILAETHGMNELDYLKYIRALRSPFYGQSALRLSQKELELPYLFTKRLYLFTKGEKA